MGNVSSRWPFYGFVTFLVVLSGGFATGLWSMTLAGQPPPKIWLIVITYLILYKKYPSNILFSYFLLFWVQQFTVAPLKVLMLDTLFVYATLSFIRSKIFWFGSTYFLGASVLAIVLFKTGYLIFSRLFEPSIAPVMFIDFILELGWTVVFVLPIYRLMKWLDEKFDSEARGDFVT
jgi:hypothetical protein